MGFRESLKYHQKYEQNTSTRTHPKNLQKSSWHQPFPIRIYERPQLCPLPITSQENFYPNWYPPHHITVISLVIKWPLHPVYRNRYSRAVWNITKHSTEQTNSVPILYPFVQFFPKKISRTIMPHTLWKRINISLSATNTLKSPPGNYPAFHTTNHQLLWISTAVQKGFNMSTWSL